MGRHPMYCYGTGGKIARVFLEVLHTFVNMVLDVMNCHDKLPLWYIG